MPRKAQEMTFLDSVGLIIYTERGAFMVPLRSIAWVAQSTQFGTLDIHTFGGSLTLRLDSILRLEFIPLVEFFYSLTTSAKEAEVPEVEEPEADEGM